MTARTTGPDHLDDALAARLRTVLDAVDAGQSQRPSTMPPWDRLQQGMRRAHRERRNRRVRQVAAAGLAIAIVVGGAGAALRVVPRLTSDSQPAQPADWPKPGPRVGDHSLLYSLPAKGPLAGDQKFVGAVQARLSDRALYLAVHHDPGPAITGTAKVLYAGDVGSFRLVLVEAEWRKPGGTYARQIWLHGAAGAAAKQLRIISLEAPVNDVSSTTAVARADASGHPAGMSAVVAVSAFPVVVRLEICPLPGQAAAVPSSDLRPDNGVYEAVAPPGRFFGFSVPGSTFNSTCTPRPPSPAADGPGASPQRS